MTPNIDREGRINQQGSTVGLARLKDTSAINKLLALPQIKSVFPRNAKLLWASKPEGDVLALHAIKITTRDGKAPLDGGAVVDARQTFDDRSGGAPIVSMNMNGEGAKVWAR